MAARFARSLAFCLAALGPAAALLAHGGQYRGPWNSVPPAGGPGLGPVTGGPGAPGGGAGPAGPLTGGRPSISDGTSWQVWWEFCKDPLLDALAVEKLLPATGSDEFFLGGTRRAFARDTQRPNEADRRDRIAAALAQALRGTNNKDLQTAAMVALAKVGIDPPGATLLELLQKHLGDGDQEVRESAALALGIAGRVEHVQPLIDLLGDDSAGRKLAGGAVPDRTRTFAAWALGLCARASSDRAVLQRVHDALLAQLRAKDEPSRDLRVAVVEALGLLGTAGTSPDKRLLWQTAGELWEFYDRDLGKGDQLVQAHVPIAVARLLGRGTSSEHARAIRRLTAELNARMPRHHAIHQSAAMALGSLCPPPEAEGSFPDATDALVRYYQDGTDQLTRFFGVLSLGRIGGAHHRSLLLLMFQKGNRAIERPWIGLALGLVARERARAPGGVVDEEIGKLLLDEFVDQNGFDAKSAMALAIGLCGYEPAADALLPHLQDGQMNDMLVGYVAIALALLDHHRAADQLLQLLELCKRRPFVLQQCAVALGRLGDVRVVPTLLKMLAEGESTAALAGLATALGAIRDRRSIDPLIETLQDRERTWLGKAFAAVALGGVGDKDLLPWNTAIAVGMNYMATVDTLTNGSTGVLDIL